jgi:uncharacterized membrane protein HdeD (DUF308 family)
LSLRQKYFVAASVCFIVLGLIIVARAAVAGTYIVGLLGVVLIALGVVRIRDFLSVRRQSHDT